MTSSLHSAAIADMTAHALAQLQIVANELEQAYLLAGVESPYMNLACRVDQIAVELIAASR